MRRKKWVVSKGDKEKASRYSREYDLDSLSVLLACSDNREEIDDINAFFDEDAPLTLNPMTIKDMDKAKSRIQKAIDDFELICIYGDYDADGITSTALLYSYFESRGANVIRYIPDRIKEGYGLNKEAVLHLAGRNVKLIVTVDNGVTAVEEIKYAYSLGIEVVVTDHHQVGAKLPECEAVVDPHRPDCPSNFKEMSGVGVAFKLVCALEDDDQDYLLDEYGELIAIGTIGDVVSLTGENRVMVRRGLKCINESPGFGVSALINAASIRNKPITASTVAFTICPRINACGRMKSADKAVDLLLCDDIEAADFIASEIVNLNIERQTVENETYNSAVEMIESNDSLKYSSVIVVDGDNWHKGVIGIVSAKITEKYGKPSIVLSKEGDEATGSCRSIEGFSIYNAVETTSDLLTHFGGHTLAAGLGIKTADIPEFRRRINEFADKTEMPFPIQRVDCKIIPSSVSLDIVSSISCLEPFGVGNPVPIFGLFGVTIEETSGLSEGKHTRIVFSKDGIRTGTVYFGMRDKCFPFSVGDSVDLAVNLEKNIYNGEERLSVIIRGIRPSNTNEDKVLSALSLYEKFRRGGNLSPDEVSSLIPDRQVQIDVFKSIKAKPVKDSYYEILCVRLGDDGSNLASYMTAVDIMVEMGVLAVDEDNRIFAPPVSSKVNLECSPTMKKLRSLQV